MQQAQAPDKSSGMMYSGGARHKVLLTSGSVSSASSPTTPPLTGVPAPLRILMDKTSLCCETCWFHYVSMWTKGMPSTG